MFKNIIIACISILSLYACNRIEKRQNKTAINLSDSLKPQDTVVSVPTKEAIYFNYSNTVLHEEFRDSISIKFSDLLIDDKFTFYVPEGNINKTKSILKIFNDAGELLYEKSFQTSELIYGYDLEDIKTDEELEKYILDKAREVLADNSFIDITDKEKIAEEGGILNQPADSFENYKVFTECQNEKRSLFCIGLAEEDITFIGYSKRLQKVVDIIYCC
ncbi:hypothetical protein [Flavobacterium tructae]|uniref:hypothetical protein n=1 Tax=Flavobacterium tructae TaxID=1114873 RepID=UPI0035A8BDC8